MPLKELICDFQPDRDAEILRSIKTLEKINGKPAAEFWKDVEQQQAAAQAWLKHVAALPAAEQVEEVRKELMHRNPGFDGKFEHKIEDGVVTEFKIVTDQVTDIAPIRVWNTLRELDLFGTWTGKPKGLLADLTPLTGMNLAGLTRLNLSRTQMSDGGLAPFKGCKNLTHLELHYTQVSDAGLVHFQDSKALTFLNLGGTKVSDAGLAYFKDCKRLQTLSLAATKVSDAGLAYFKGVPLKVLQIENTGITDLTPLQGMPLVHILLTPMNITRGLDILRDMKSLNTIGIAFGKAWPVAEFWERYDKGEFK
jgi:Leucine-rich repeat (LRR) protein